MFIGLTGSNGSGKSTLLKCIYRVLKPDQGAVYINQKDISHLSYKQSAREMAVVAQKTPCLILDEPTNHLDITYQLELLDIVKSLNITVISAIHDLNMAAMFCDRLYVLRDGQILSSGTPEEVLTTQMIREVYHVESQIVYDADGHMHILYLQNGHSHT